MSDVVGTGWPQSFQEFIYAKTIRSNDHGDGLNEGYQAGYLRGHSEATQEAIAEIERLREALKPFAKLPTGAFGLMQHNITNDKIVAARKAINKE